MIGRKAEATNGSVAVAGDNNGTIINFNVPQGSKLPFDIGVKAERTLGTYLGLVIAVVAQQSLSEYGHDYERDLSNEVFQKLAFNYIAKGDQIVKNYRKYFFVLERAYKGVEQSNNDARVLVRLRAGSIYEKELTKACAQAHVLSSGRITYSRNNSRALIEAVKHQLVTDFLNTATQEVDPLWVDLAVSLLVSDAVAECDVLERDSSVTPA